MCIFPCCNNNNVKYGPFCNKHKRNYLVNNNIIVKNRFTNKKSDYLKKDISNTLKTLDKKRNINFKKNELFDILSNELLYLNKIIKIQRFYKNYLYFNKGPGLKNRTLSKNDIDFYTLEPINEIETKYFISYKENNNIWCFDIRSIKELFKTDKEILNPYSREKIPVNEINRIKSIINKFKKQKISLKYKEEKIYTKEEQLKRIVVDIFSEMTRTGYYMDIKWFYELTNYGLKHLYKFLEDIWNYRAQLTLDVKKKISPPNGILYNVSVNDVFKLNSRYDLRNVIINELNKIYSNCNDNGFKSLGYMYFIIGLSQVNKNCFDAHTSWITYSI